MRKINYTQDEDVKLPEIAQEILDMGQEDQEAIARDDGSAEKLFKKHTIRLKEIIADIGYPIISLVGKKASHWAWLIVQHSDHDVDFQENCLTLMKTSPVYEIKKENIAYLEDRVRKNRGLPQLYGTQFVKTNGTWKVYLLEDPQNVNARRKSMELNSFEQYKSDFFS